MLNLQICTVIIMTKNIKKNKLKKIKKSKKKKKNHAITETHGFKIDAHIHYATETDATLIKIINIC